jgi:hypothetical protein
MKSLLPTLGFILLASQAAPAIAQPTLLGLAICKQIKDDAARLKCFDAAFSGAGETATAKEEAPVGWSFKQDKSPVDDSPQISATLIGENSGGALVARCAEKKTEVAIIPKDFMGSGTGGRIKILLRIDDAPAVTESWLSSSNGRAAFSPSPVALLKILPDNAILFARLTGYSGVEHDVKFALGSVSEVKAKISQTCKWTDPKPSAQTKPTIPSTSRARSALPSPTVAPR